MTRYRKLLQVANFRVNGKLDTRKKHPNLYLPWGSLVPKTLIIEIILKSLITCVSESGFLECILELCLPYFFKKHLSFWSNHQFSRTLEMHSMIQKYIQIRRTDSFQNGYFTGFFFNVT